MKQSNDSAWRAVAQAADDAVGMIGRAVGHVQKIVTEVQRDSLAIARESEALYAAIASGVSDTVRGAPRFARIVSEIAQVATMYKLHRGRAEVIGDEAAAPALERLHARSAERLYRLCVELRGGVLKVGQFASARVDLLPPAYVEALGRLQDRVPPVPFEAIAARVESELGAPLSELFSSFEEAPIAAASLAQVHGATLADGTRVAVKVQVPGIEEIIDIDLVALRVAAGALRDLLPVGDLDTVVDELARSVRAELDFSREADASEGFRARFAGDDDVVVPRVIPERSSRRVLTLERVDGERLTDWLDACEARGDEAARDALLATMVRSFCAQVLEHGVFHADPHPGNFLVLPGPRLALLDFGSVRALSERERSAYARLTAAVLGNDAAGVTSLLSELGFEADDPDALAMYAEVFLERFRESAASFAEAGIDPRAELERAMRLARDYPIARVPDSFVLLGRVFGSLGGLMLRYRPRVDLFRVIAPYLANAMRPL